MVIAVAVVRDPLVPPDIRSIHARIGKSEPFRHRPTGKRPRFKIPVRDLIFGALGLRFICADFIKHSARALFAFLTIRPDIVYRNVSVIVRRIVIDNTEIHLLPEVVAQIEIICIIIVRIVDVRRILRRIDV